MLQRMERLLTDSPTSVLWGAPLAIIFVYTALRIASHDSKLPPGPRAEPIIGHARSIPIDYSWLTFASWRKKYGDILYAYVLNRQMVIFNTFADARDIMGRSIKHSDRPRLVAQELMGWAQTLVLLPYGDRWRKQRRLTLKFLGNEALRSFRSVFKDELEIFHRNVVNAQPDQLKHNINRLVAGMIAKITYGHEIKSSEDKLIAMIEHAVVLSISVGSPGATIIDFFPILQYVPAWIPGFKIRKHITEARRAVDESFLVPYEQVQRERALGTAKSSFISRLLDDYDATMEKDPMHEEDIKALGGVVFSAGSETSSSVLSTFFLMMLLHPDVASRAQEEIDNVLGYGTRPPSLDDRDSLPYIDCILKELYRINPPVPLGVAHRSMEPDNFKGFNIPKGAMLVPNIWMMMNDEEFFPNPEKFLPERHMHEGNAKVSDECNPAKIVFGFGKRICPGRFLADQVVWLTMANTLTCLNILPEVDTKTGKEILPKPEFTSGFTTAPKPYNCRIVPRSKLHEAMIKGEP